MTAQVIINLGRGSEIVYDFESGADSISNWSLAYKNPYTPDKYYFNDQISVVSSSEGKVRNGEYALKVTADGDSITCMNWCQTRINGLNIDLTDAVSLSFWMYIPEGSHGYEWDFGNAIPVGLGHWLKYGTGWQYFTVNVSDIGTNVTNLDQIRLYHSDTNNDANGYEHNKEPNYYADAVFYIDDITINYSSAVDDNKEPEISSANISYEGTDSAVAINGQTLPTNTVAFTANAVDNYSGLDTSSVAVYVDGNQVAASCSESGMIATGDITLANGGHVVRFQISDKMGNQSTFFEYYFVLNGSSAQNTINYVPADPTLKDVAEDSLVWMNLEATAIENVDKVTTVIDLDQNSKWELAHMELAEGFTATYSVNAETNDATIVISRTDKVTATGNAVLASLPIRVWSPVFHHDDLSGNEDANAYRLVSVMSHVEKGILTETDGTTVSFGSLEQVTSTEWNGTRLKNGDKNGYHIHTAVELENKGATCTTNGYTGRTFCEGCNSVVVWGTNEPATGHTYAIDETSGLMQCSCGDLFTGTLDGIEYTDGVAMDGWVGNSYYANGAKLTGVQKVPAPDDSGEFYYNFGEEGVCENKTKYTGVFLDSDGEVYRYAYLGTLQSGWKLVDNEWYYFRSTTMAAPQEGYKYSSGLPYEFEENGKLKSGVWTTVAEGTRYWYGPTYHQSGWKTIDNKEYYFKNGYRYEGIRYVRASYNSVPVWYDFGEDGALVERLTLTGWITTEEGPFYLVNGETQLGLIHYEGNYYYIRSDGSYATGEYNVSSQRTNGLLPAGTYAFAEDGKMLNGVVNKDGTLYYYTNGKINGAGLLKIGEDYFYAKSNGMIVTGNYYVTRTNGLEGFAVGWYMFDTNGRLILVGIVNKDGIMYYYQNGKVSGAGLVKVGDSYYYAKPNGQIATGKYYVTITNNVDGFSVNWYEFAEDGKMLNGVVNKDGTLYYYTNGKVNGAGLIQVDGNYYYAKSNGQIVTDKYYVTRTNNMEGFTVRWYEFAEDGKMLNGIVEKDGTLYYYTNGKLNGAGLIQIDGAYYYAKSNGQIVTGTYYVTRTNGIEGFYVKYYKFAENGKLIQ